MLSHLQQLLTGSLVAVNPFTQENPARFDKEFDHEKIEAWIRMRFPTDKTKKQDADKQLFTIVGLDGTEMEGFVEELKGERGVAKKLCNWIDVAWLIDAKENQIKCNEFFHELAIGMIVKKHLSDVAAFSQVGMTDMFWDKKTKTGWLGFTKHQGEALEEITNDLSFSEFKSVIVQVLAAICVAQTRVQLKHHDLHLGNVLVNFNEEKRNEIQTLELPFGPIQFPSKGVEVAIIDFGLSSATDPDSKQRFVRVDEELLIGSNHTENSEERSDSSSEDSGWGVWGHELKGDEGYDVAMFVESLVEELFKERPLNLDKLELIVDLQHLVNINFTDRGRPAERCSVDWKEVFQTLDCC